MGTMAKLQQCCIYENHFILIRNVVNLLIQSNCS